MNSAVLYISFRDKVLNLKVSGFFFFYLWFNSNFKKSKIIKISFIAFKSLNEKGEKSHRRINRYVEIKKKKKKKKKVYEN